MDTTFNNMNTPSLTDSERDYSEETDASVNMILKEFEINGKFDSYDKLNDINYILKCGEESLKRAVAKAREQGYSEEWIEYLVEGYKEGWIKGFKQGFKLGVVKGSIETARSLKSHGMDYDFISNITGISKGKLEKLLKYLTDTEDVPKQRMKR